MSCHMIIHTEFGILGNKLKELAKKSLKNMAKKNAKNTKPYHQLKVFSKTKVFSILQNSSKTLLFDHYGIVEPYHFIETRMQRRPQVVFLGY